MGHKQPRSVTSSLAVCYDVYLQYARVFAVENDVLLLLRDKSAVGETANGLNRLGHWHGIIISVRMSDIVPNFGWGFVHTRYH